MQSEDRWSFSDYALNVNNQKRACFVNSRMGSFPAFRAKNAYAITLQQVSILFRTLTR